MTNYQKPRDATPACGCGPCVCICSMFWGPPPPSSELQSLPLMCIIDFKAHSAGCGKNLLEEDTGTGKDGRAGGTVKNSTVRLSGTKVQGGL